MRIRYTTSHPADMDDDLIAAHGDTPKLMPFLHLPVQAGSDRVLKAMNRSHSVASYLELLDRFRAARPDLALSGDFIVGFPGETDAEFEETLQLVGEVAYAQAFNGLENRSGIVAMNSGSHANPCYAGTTIYSYSDVLEVHEVSPDVGALRMRLVAVKDGNPADDPDFQRRVQDDKGKERYNPRVLLDLDYWELMPKRSASS